MAVKAATKVKAKKVVLPATYTEKCGVYKHSDKLDESCGMTDEQSDALITHVNNLNRRLRAQGKKRYSHMIEAVEKLTEYTFAQKAYALMCFQSSIGPSSIQSLVEMLS